MSDDTTEVPPRLNSTWFLKTDPTRRIGHVVMVDESHIRLEFAYENSDAYDWPISSFRTLFEEVMISTLDCRLTMDRPSVCFRHSSALAFAYARADPNRIVTVFKKGGGWKRCVA